MDVRCYRYPHFNSLLVHTKYTYNMAAWFCVQFNDVTAPDASARFMSSSLAGPDIREPKGLPPNRSLFYSSQTNA